MSLRLLTVDDPEAQKILRQNCKPVKRLNKSIRAQLRDMAELMYAYRGVGLAGPQVGILKRIIVIDVGEGLMQLINPVIERQEGQVVAIEGCLSIPGWVGEVARAERVVVSALDEMNRKRWVEGEGLLARALQHEIDHLNGVLFVDRARKLMREEELAKAQG